MTVFDAVRFKASVFMADLLLCFAGLMALLGISWGFALATIDEAALTFSYVFVVFNSSQGIDLYSFCMLLFKSRICPSLIGK